MGYIAALLAGVMLFALPAGAAETRIGAATAVIPDTSGTLITGVAVTVLDGSDVYKQQRVLTEAQGRAQLAFLDGSAITVGPNSDVTLDEFVFDPVAGRGSATVVAAKGVLRYVGGKISKNTEVAIRTPSATIGIRGGIVVVDVEAGGRTNAYFLYGERMSLTANGVTEVAQRPGSVISMTPGQAPTPARIASFGEMRQAMNGLQAGPNRQQPGQPGQPGQIRQGQPGQPGQPTQVGHGQPGQQQPGQPQPGQPQPGNQANQPAGQPGMTGGQSGGPGQFAASGQGPGQSMVAQPGAPGQGAVGQGAMGQPGGPAVDRGIMAARMENGLSRIGSANSNIRPANIGVPNVGPGRLPGQVGRGPNGPGFGPGFGPRPIPIDGIPRLVQQGIMPPPINPMMPPPPPPPQ